MLTAKAQSTDHTAASLVAKTDMQQAARAGGIFHVRCYGADGELKWETSEPNLVVNQGLQDMNSKYFTASGYTAAWYLGLVTGPASGTTFAAGDTLASHAGWTEYTDYAGSRKAVTFGTATTADPSVISNTASAASFTISGAGGVIAGAFLGSVASGTSGILFSASDFQSPGDRTVVSGDTLNVTYSFSLDAA
tara:strand:- start:1048 stop:1626 length:579 start_codon:yes stop_codon:yes gene_type:complete